MMKSSGRWLACAFLAARLLAAQSALQRPDVTFKIFQFPGDKIPRIDGNTDDWAIVPDSYAIGMDQLMDSGPGHLARDPKNLDVKVKVGWVKGLNRLYFLYEAYDNYWDFSRTDLHNDIFEVVVDGDLSGGPLIDIYHRDVWTPEAVGQARSTLDPRISQQEAHWATHGVHAQNYHIFTPPATRTGRWPGVARSTSSACPTPTPPTTIISSPARAASWCWSFISRPSTTPPATARSAPWKASSPRTS